jgi:hypothetical protein
MRNDFKTRFWRDALESLPEPLRHRYVLQMKAAERWELRLGALIQAWSRAKAGVAKLFQAPRGAH